ncbi:MAG: copper oxidase [Blastocatellia bacterium]
MSKKEELRLKLPKLLKKGSVLKRGLILCAFIALGVLPARGQTLLITPTPDATPVPVPPVPECAVTVTANVVAFDQILTYNRFGSFDPGGMMFALKRDVVPIIAANGLTAGNVQLRGNKRPRPIVLRVNEGDCLLVNFTNWLDPVRAHVEQLQFLNQPNRRPYYDVTPFFGPVEDQIDGSVRKILPLGAGTYQVKQTSPTVEVLDDGTVHLSQDDTPATRAASVHVNGLDYYNGVADDGANVGKNATSLANPNQVKSYKWIAAKQGQYFLYSTGATIGGEGNGGQVDHGLFGAVIVEPKGSKWYRSQVTNAQLNLVKTGTTAKGQPIINYEAVSGGDPVLNMLKAGEIIYSDLNAIVTDFTAANDNCFANGGATRTDPPSGTCGQWFREFTVLFHDELETGAPAFPELIADESVFHSVRDGFGINYGSQGLGAQLLANRKKIGPGKDCAECEYEEFFLESWVDGDPALLVTANPTTHVATAALFPDDPSNVHHSYLGDPVRFRNIHAGPKETHVFHLHAHQWLQSPRDQNSTYLDSQTISPGASYTYEINYGGTGNRNLTPGDSIFHCHLYPHFAQGMWELWRSHDVFEDGSVARNLPDNEIAAGTPNPAIIPIKNIAMPLMPTAAFKGFPFYIGAVKGHRPSQPPLALDFDGGLRRHYITQGTTIDGVGAIKPDQLADPVHQRVVSLNPDPNLRAFARDLDTAQVVLLPNGGTPAELTAMSFHDGTLFPSVVVSTPYGWTAKGYDSFTSANVAAKFLVNGRAKQAGAPYADPCPANFVPDPDNGGLRPVPLRKYRAAWIQFATEDNAIPGFKTLTVNPAGWHDRQGRIAVLEDDALPMLQGALAPEPLFFRANSGDCIDYRVTNLMRKALNLDDFQVFQDTDIVGQHIHLVKFDVTSSDGAGNGWNYESGAFAGEAVVETIEAMRKFNGCVGEDSGDPRDGTDVCPVALPHPKFGVGPDGTWLGAQTLIERWWADPLVNRNGKDRTLRTVFTHDHFSPSGHQHHGLYAGLVIEPTDSVWTNLTGTVTFGSRASDGGPTSFAANILAGPGQTRSYREFLLEIADFAIVYTPDLIPVNPPNRVEHAPPFIVGSVDIDNPELHPFPEAISAEDPGTMLINYRHEPIPLRIAQKVGGIFQQKAGQPGDMAYAFSSVVHGDPFTPILPAYPGDRVQVRLLQGAQEEQHVLNIHAHKWYFEPGTPHDTTQQNNSGFTNSQAIGISEHFEFNFNDKVAPVFSSNGIADFLYQSAPTDDLWNGMWGLMRTYKYLQPGVLNLLPNNPFIPPPDPAGGAGTNALGTPDQTAKTKAPTTPFANPEKVASPPRPGEPVAVADPIATPDPKTPDPFTGDGTATPDEVKEKAGATNPDGKASAAATGGINTCPTVPGVPIRNVILEAWLAKDLLAALPNAAKGIIYNSKFDFFDPAGIVYINAADRAAIAAGTKILEPLVLRVNAGDCVNVTFRNRLPAAGVPEYTSFNEVPPIIPRFNFNQFVTSKRLTVHPQLVTFDVSGSDGGAIGFNPDTTVGPGQSINYAWYAGLIDVDNSGNIILTPAEFGVTNLRDYGDVIKHSSHGAVASLVVEPKGAQYFAIGTTTPITSGAQADIVGAAGGTLFREFVVHYQDDVTMKSANSGGIGMENQDGEDDAEDSAQKAFNYRTEPIWARFGLPPETPIQGGPGISLNDLDYKNSLSSNTTSFNCGATPCDPLTPIFQAKPGTNVRFRLAQAAGHARQHGFTVFGHHWNFEPWQNKSLVQGTNPLTFEIGSYSGFGPTRHFNILTVAGGLRRKTGDFLYRTQDSFGFAGGLWGIFRVSLTAP